MNNIYKIKIFHNLIFSLLLVQPFLGATTLTAIQITVEIILIIFLSISFLTQKHEPNHLILLIILLLVSAISLIKNDIFVFLLNFKIYLLSILTLIFASKLKYIPKLFFNILFVLLVTYPFITKIFDFWFLESLPFFEKKSVYIYSRPVGILGNPHSSSQLTALFFFFFYNKKKYLLSIIALFALFFYSSSTALLAIVGQIIYNFVFYVIKLKIKPVYFIVLTILVFYFSVNLVAIYQENNNDDFLRLSSASVILPMLFDLNYYKGIFNIYPISSEMFVMNQENTFADVGNEIGLIKIIIEGGVILSFAYLFNVFKKINYFFIFIFLTMFHYTYIMVQPLFLFSLILINKQLNEKNSSCNY